MKLGRVRWSVWKLAPDSDRRQRHIITTHDGDDEVCGMLPEHAAEEIVAAHNKVVREMRREIRRARGTAR